MSLTNDMLLNLEKRRNNRGSSALLDAQPSSASNKSYYAIYFLMTFFICSAMAAIIYFDFPFFKSVSPKPTSIITHKIIAPPKQAVFIAPLDRIDNHLRDSDTLDSTIAVKTPIEEPTSDIIDQYYQEALALVSQNQIPAAIHKLQNVIQNYPDAKDIRLALATLYLQNNNISDATRILSDGLVLAPGDLSLTLLYARTLMMAHDNIDALNSLNKIADITGNNTSYLDLLASAQESLGHYSDAIAIYQSLLKQDPANSRWLVNLGISYEKNGDKNKALEAYQNATAAGQLPIELQNYVRRRIHYLGG